jgi:predicted P-loop ATPase
MRGWLAEEMRVLIGKDDAENAMLAVAARHPFDSAVDWLQRKPPWDGVERCKVFLAEAFGADCESDARYAYHAHIGTGFLVSAVARAMAIDRPVKVDTMLVLEGEQGLGKGSCLIELVGHERHMDMTESPHSKDFFLALRGSLLVEIGEMHAFSKGEVSRVKQIMTMQRDKYRAPFDRHPKEHARRSIFVGTANDDAYLTDPTGGRRFLPVSCRKADLEWIREHRDQLWAEALVLWREGFPWWQYPQDEAHSQQEARYMRDSWEDPIAEWLEGKAPDARYDNLLPIRIVEATTHDILARALQIEVGRHGKPEQMRVGAIMRRMGWRRVRSGTQVRQWVYRRPDAAESPDEGEELPL